MKLNPRQRSRLVITAITVAMLGLFFLALSTKTLVASGDCEDEGCGAMTLLDDAGRPMETVYESCCKTCAQTGWALDDDGATPALSPFAELPACRMDRCGKCPFELTATGFNVLAAFLVVSYEQIR